jgi:hypothetical protein
MRTTRCIEALVRDSQPFDWLSAEDVGIEYLVNIGGCHVAVPDRFRINNDVRSVFALAKAAGPVGPDTPFESSL